MAKGLASLAQDDKRIDVALLRVTWDVVIGRLLDFAIRGVRSSVRVAPGPPSDGVAPGESREGRLIKRHLTFEVSRGELGKSANYRSSRSTHAQLSVINCKESTCEQRGCRAVAAVSSSVERISRFLKKISEKGLTRGVTFRIFALPFGRNGTLTNTHQGVDTRGKNGLNWTAQFGCRLFENWIENLTDLCQTMRNLRSDRNHMSSNND